MSKKELRERVRARVKLISAPERAEAARNAAALLERQTIWQKARSVLFYAPLPDELDLWPMFEQAVRSGKKAALPHFDRDLQRYVARMVGDCSRDVVTGHYGIREPGPHCALFELNRLDLLLVPGVAFDFNGRRLGRGRGYYDRLLTGVAGFTCGVAFDEQVVEYVPSDSHDVRLNCILTPSRWIMPPRAVPE